MTLKNRKIDRTTAPDTPYHYTECGLDDVYLLGGYAMVHDSDYGELVSVQDALGLHRAIGLHLVEDRKALSGKEVRFLRKEMDLTQAELGKLLGVTDQSVARWEKDQTPRHASADYLLRVLFAEHVHRRGGFNARKLLTRLEASDASGAVAPQKFARAEQGWQTVGRTD